MKENKIENPIAVIDFKEAKMLADLGSIIQDLRSTMLICSRLKKMLNDKSCDNLLVESFWTTALIKYARCFKSGKRFGLDISIFDDLNGEPHKVHQLYMNMRNKHIAHSVNPFEQMQVGLVLTPKENIEKQVIGVVTLAMRHLVSNIDGIHQLGLLSKVILKKLCKIAKNYEKKTLDKGKTIPIDELYKRVRPQLKAVGPDKSGKPRE